MWHFTHPVYRGSGIYMYLYFSRLQIEEWEHTHRNTGGKRTIGNTGPLEVSSVGY